MTDARPAAAIPPEADAPLSRRRAIAVWSLVVLATLLTLVSSLTLWVKRQALDTDSWVDTSAQLLDNDEIRGQLALYLVDTLYANVDVAARLEELLPENQQGLAPIAAAGLREFSVRAADELLQGPRVQAAWEEANRRAHERLLAVVEGEGAGPVSTENGDVVLDVSPLIERLEGRLGVAEQLPPDAGQITILQSDQLETAQTSVNLIRKLSLLLVFVVLGLYALAIFLARGRRRRVLRASAASFVLVGLLLLVIRRVAGQALVNSIVDADSVRPAGNATWLIGTSMLRDVAIALLAYGVVVLAGTWLAGPSRYATSARRAIAPTFRERPLVVFGAVAIAYLLVLLWGPTPATQRLLGIVVLGVLLFVGVEALRRQTVAEFPAAEAR
jgi:hypothetical protein